MYIVHETSKRSGQNQQNIQITFEACLSLTFSPAPKSNDAVWMVKLALQQLLDATLVYNQVIVL